MKTLSLLFVSVVVGLLSCSETPKPLAPPGAAKTLNIITWEDYLAPEVIDAFTKRTGTKINLTSFENTEDLIGQLSAYSDRFDLVIFDNSSIPRLANAKLLKRLDKKRLQNFGNLDAKFLNKTTDPNNEHSVPYLWGCTLVAYRKDRIPNPEESFKLLFDERYQGKILMIDDPVELFGVAHIMQGRSINSFEPDELEAAAVLLKDQVAKVGAKHVSDKEVRDALGSGECWAAMCYSGDAAWVAEDHPEVGYFFPKEGATLWLDIMAISRDAQNEDAAYRFVDFLLEPEIGALNANSLWYASPNKAAQPHMSQELLEDHALFPPSEILRKCDFLEVTPEGAATQFSKLMREITATPSAKTVSAQ